jgi:hypothetical protein
MQRRNARNNNQDHQPLPERNLQPEARANGRRGPRDGLQNGRHRQEEERERLPKRKFTKTGDSQVTINQICGEEAEEYLRKIKFPHLDKLGKVYINNRYPHGHGFGAFIRKRSEEMALLGLYPRSSAISVGANAARLHTSDDLQETFALPGTPYTKLIDRVRAMCPLVTPLDETRHRNWQMAIKNSPDFGGQQPNANHNTCWVCKGGKIVQNNASPVQFTEHGIRLWQGIATNVERAKHFENRCPECAARKDIVHSADSIYYPGVMEEMEWRCVLDGSTAIFGFYDYHTPITKGIASGTYWDDEGRWDYLPTSATVRASNRGNSEDYQHGILQTGGADSWIYKSNYGSFWLLCETLDTVINRDVPYRTVRMQAIRSNDQWCPVRSDKVFAAPGNFFISRALRIPQARGSVEEATISGNDSDEITTLSEEWKNRLARGIDNGSEKISLQGEYLVMTRHQRTGWEVFGYKPKLVSEYKAQVGEVCSIMARVACAATLSTSLTYFKKFRIERERDLMDEGSDEKPNPQYEPDPLKRFIKLRRVGDAYAIAEVIAAADVKIVSLNHAQSATIEEMKTWTDKTLDTRFWLNLFLVAPTTMWRIIELIGPLFQRLLKWIVIMTSLYYGLQTILGWMPLVRATNYPLNVMDPDGIMFEKTDHYWAPFVLAMIFAMLEPTINKARMKWSKRAYSHNAGVIPALCVRDDQRLIMPLNPIYPSKYKIRDPAYDVKDLRDLPCEHKGAPGAVQIFPIIDYDDRRDPTVIHSCKRTQTAAALRAMGNTLYPDANVFRYFSKFYKKTIMKEVMPYLDENPVHITIEDWLAKYPQHYRENMQRAMAKDGWNLPAHYKYSAFPKIELQTSEVPFYQMNTSLNKIKERQISGPPAPKKLLLNPVIAAMQKTNGHAINGYCGDKNLEQISLELSAEDNRPHREWLSSDGSGFDMTQTQPINRLYAWYMMKFLTHPNVTLGPGLDLQMALDILQDSLILDVDVCNGVFNYKADGRASGDGWTSDANTVANIMYYRYIWAKKGLFYGRDFRAWFKGDDMLAVFYGKQALEKTQKAAVAIKEFFLDKMPEKITRFGLGQIVKFVDVDENICRHRFLNCDIMRVEYGVMMIMRLDVALQKFSYTTKFDKAMYEKFRAGNACGYDFYMHILSLLAAKTASYKAFMGKFPIFRCLVERSEQFIRQAESGTRTRIKPDAREAEQWYQKTMCEENQVTSAGKYVDFLFERYGITHKEIVSIEKKIMRASNLVSLIRVEEFAKLFE